MLARLFDWPPSSPFIFFKHQVVSNGVEVSMFYLAIKIVRTPFTQALSNFYFEYFTISSLPLTYCYFLVFYWKNSKDINKLLNENIWNGISKRWEESRFEFPVKESYRVPMGWWALVRSGSTFIWYPQDPKEAFCLAFIGSCLEGH